MTPVVRHLEEPLGDRLCRDHLSTCRDDEPFDRAEEAARVAVCTHDHGRAGELLERRDARLLADLDSSTRREDSEPPYESSRLKHPVGNMAERRSEATGE